MGQKEDLEAMRAERDEWRGTAMNKLELMNSTALRAKDAEIETLRARVAKLEPLIQAFVDFDRLPVSHKRPDVFELQVRQPILRAALPREDGE